jgi:D-arabinose 1-dehydrogenase-like Zn-dependent alcohol dehydrogenase
MDPIEVAPNQLLFGKKGIKGWAGGIPTDSEDTLRFAEMTGVRPMIEKYPLVKAAEGYGDRSQLTPRNPRREFSEACTVL